MLGKLKRLALAAASLVVIATPSTAQTLFPCSLSEPVITIGDNTYYHCAYVSGGTCDVCTYQCEHDLIVYNQCQS